MMPAQYFDLSMRLGMLHFVEAGVSAISQKPMLSPIWLPPARYFRGFRGQLSTISFLGCHCAALSARARRCLS